MKSNAGLIIMLLFSAIGTAFCQNYVGFSKEYIIEAIKNERKDLRGPLIHENQEENYIIYTTRDSRGAIMYYFSPMLVTLDTGQEVEAEICIKYYSKNKCLGFTKCPQMDEVMRSLNSHFTPGGTYLQWIDTSRRNPQEWVLVRDNDYFEVHVMELR